MKENNSVFEVSSDGVCFIMTDINNIGRDMESKLVFNFSNYVEIKKKKNGFINSPYIINLKFVSLQQSNERN